MNRCYLIPSKRLHKVYATIVHLPVGWNETVQLGEPFPVWQDWRPSHQRQLEQKTHIYTVNHVLVSMLAVSFESRTIFRTLVNGQTKQDFKHFDYTNIESGNINLMIISSLK